MSSGGWELVGKRSSKDKSSNGKAAKLTKTEKKNFIANSPKLEDFLPLSEVKSLYDSLDGNKENKKPAKEKDSKSRENEEKKRQQKLKQQQQQQQADKNKKQQQQQQQRAKDKSTKSSDKGSNGVNVDELNSLLENDRAKFPDAPLLWLKDLVSYLDAKLPWLDREDPSYRDKPDPLSTITKSTRSLLERTIKLAGPENAQLCWEGTLATMIRNISNNAPDTGCRVFLQLLAQTSPEMTIANLPKLASLRNSYQNKKPIGLSLLWAFSQAGKKNLGVGLTVWHEIMAPMLESRSYAAHVVNVLDDLLSSASNKSSSSITIERYLDIVDDFYLGKINVPASVDSDVDQCMKHLRSRMVKSDQINLPRTFETLIGKITPKSSLRYRNEILRALVDCTSNDPRALTTWTSLYPKHLYQTDLLLKQLLADWDTIRSEIQTKELSETLQNLRASCLAPKKGKEESLILSCVRTSEALAEKMSASKKKEASSFPFRAGIIVLLVLIGAVVTYDCQRHGSFEASNTGVFLKKSGAIHYGSNALNAAIHCKDKSLAYLETNFPEYYRTTVEITEKYYRLFADLALVTRNLLVKAYANSAQFVAEKKPLVTDNIEYYFPGLLDNLHKRSLIEIERVKTYSSAVQEQFALHTVNFVRWMETNVFVGNLSPKNMRGYATQAVKTTQQFASQAYDWVYEKVQTLSKVH